MASSDCIARTYQKQYEYSTADGSNIITLIDNRLNLIQDKIPNPDSTTWVNGFVKVLTCKSVISSLPETPLPDYADDDTESQRLTKTQAVIWGSPAYRLAVYLADAGTPITWQERVFYNLTNSYGFPYLLTTLLDGLTTDIARDLAEGGKLGIAFQDIGWGLPKAEDSIVVDCVWSAEYNWIKLYDINISQPVVVQTATVQQVTQKHDSYTNTRVGTTAVQLMAANLNRLSGNIKNNSANTIYYGLGTTPTASVNSGSIAANATVPLPAGNTSSVSVIANTGIANSVTADEVYNVSNP